MASSYMPSYNCSYALVVGIDHYQASDVLPPLNTAAHDARAVAELLQMQYGFDVTLLLNEEATRSAIVEAYEHLRASTHFDDRFVTYFAGHGIGLEGNVRVEGWLAAYDSDPQRRFRMVRMQDMSDPNLTAAKHSLVILDTCHAGLALQFSPMRASAGIARSADEALRHFMTRRSYQIITSTDAKRTATDAGMLDDHTPFTGYLLRALQGQDLDACDPVTGLMTTSSVAQYIQSSMAVHFRDWQAPQLGTLPGDEGGILIWEVPDPMEVIPERLRRALTSPDPDARYYALDRAVRLLDDPRIGSPLGRLLEDMATNDSDEDVRRKVFLLLRGEATDTIRPAIRVEPEIPSAPSAPLKKPRPRPAISPLVGMAQFAWIPPIIALGWGMSWYINFLRQALWLPIFHPLAYLAMAVSGALGGAVTMIAMQRVTRRALSRRKLWMFVGGWGLGWLVLHFAYTVILNPLFDRYYHAGLIQWLLGGIISGVLMDVALRQIHRRTPVQTGVLIAVWIAAWMGAWIFGYQLSTQVQMILFNHRIALRPTWSIGWALAGLIGGGASIWQAARLRLAKTE